eukprot:m.87539 g.87539  ORF g.87539 m.87539 type:complete len:1496 (+) comp14783_c0_seq1:109-4596(+)
MASWRDLRSNRFVPLHRTNNDTITAAELLVLSLTDVHQLPLPTFASEDDQDGYRLLCNLTLFDDGTSRFFGRTWTSAAISITAAQISTQNNTLSLPLTFDVGALTPQTDREAYAILELVLTPNAAPNDASAISLGWTAIQVPSHRTALDTYGQAGRMLTSAPMQSGSPRALLIATGSMSQVLAEVNLLSTNAGQRGTVTYAFSRQSYPNSLSNYLPLDYLFSHHDPIPGLVLQSRSWPSTIQLCHEDITRNVSNLALTLQPDTQDFLGALQTDLKLVDDFSLDAQIDIERFSIELAVHNGLKLLAPAMTVPLQWDAPTRTYRFPGTLPLSQMLHAEPTAIVARLLVEYNVHTSTAVEPRKRGGLRNSLRRKPNGSQRGSERQQKHRHVRALFWGYVCPFKNQSAEAMSNRQRLKLTLRNLELDLCPWTGPLYSGLMGDLGGKQLTAKTGQAELSLILEATTTAGTFHAIGRALGANLRASPPQSAQPNQDQSAAPLPAQEPQPHSLAQTGPLVDEAADVHFTPPFQTPQRPISRQAHSTGLRTGPVARDLASLEETGLETGPAFDSSSIAHGSPPSSDPVAANLPPALSSPTSVRQAAQSVRQTTSLALPNEDPDHDGSELLSAASIPYHSGSDEVVLAPTSGSTARAAQLRQRDGLSGDGLFLTLPRGLRAELQTSPLVDLVDPDVRHSLRLDQPRAHVPHSPARLQLTVEQQDAYQEEDIRIHFAAFQLRSVPVNQSHPGPGALPSTTATPTPPAALQSLYLKLAVPGCAVITSPNLRVGQSLEVPNDGSGVLYLATTVASAAGWGLQFSLSPTAMGMTRAQLVTFLSTAVLEVQVFNGTSHLLVGTAGLQLKYALRAGFRAVETPLELDVHDPSATSTPAGSGLTRLGHKLGGALAPTSSLGVLYLRLANVGRKAKRNDPTALAKPNYVHVPLIETTSSGLERLPLAPRLSENHPELAAAMMAQQQTEEDKRKQARLQAIKQRHHIGPHHTNLSSASPAQSPLNLSTVASYRTQLKPDVIAQGLRTHLTRHQHVHAAYGETVYVEFCLENPFDHQVAVLVTSPCPDLVPITNSVEWQAYVSQHGLTTLVEQSMFQTHAQGPVLLLAANEQVTVPLRYRLPSTHAAGLYPYTSNAASTEAEGAYQHPTAMGLYHVPAESSTGTRHALADFTVQLKFETLDHGLVASCELLVTPHPPTLTKLVTLYQPEHSVFKRTLALPTSAIPASDGSPLSWRAVSSDAEVKVHLLDPTSTSTVQVFVKRAVGASPSIAMFYVLLYSQAYQLRPVAVWGVAVHSVELYTASVTYGELARTSLTIRGNFGSTRACCYSSQPLDVAVTPNGSFPLQSHSATALQLDLHPRQLPKNSDKTLDVYLTLVEEATSHLLHLFQVRLVVQQPTITKVYELELCEASITRRVAYTNHCSIPKVWHLCTNRPELITLKKQVLTLAPQEQAQIKFRVTCLAEGLHQAFVFINTPLGHTEEAFQLNITQTSTV